MSMDIYTYEHVCKGLDSGKKPKVMNTDTETSGEVYMCDHGYFNVHVGHGSEVWASEICEKLE